MRGNSHQDVDTVVVGGGQAGLAAGRELAKRGRDLVILDAHGRVGDAWRRRWDSLRLFTAARYSSLPDMSPPLPPRSYPTKDELADYLEAYAERFGLPVVTGCRVEHLARRGKQFELVAGERTFTAANVVVATGFLQTPRVPDFADELAPDVRQLHSSAYRNPSQLADGDVLVVGAANSGAEIAMELVRDRRVWLSGRHPGQEPTRAGSVPDRLLMPLMWFVASRVLSIHTPVGRKLRDHFLARPRGIPLGRVHRRDLARAGIDLVPRTSGVRDGQPVLDDGQVLDVANVVFATGFAPDWSWIDLPVLGDHGYPDQDRGVVTAEPGLYFVGLPFQHSLSSVLVGGVGRDAAHVAEHIATHRTRTRAHEQLPA